MNCTYEVIIGEARGASCEEPHENTTSRDVPKIPVTFDAKRKR